MHRITIDEQDADGCLATTVWGSERDPLYAAGSAVDDALLAVLAQHGFRSLLVIPTPTAVSDLVSPDVRAGLWDALAQALGVFDCQHGRENMPSAQVATCVEALDRASEQLVEELAPQAIFPSPPPAALTGEARRISDSISGAAIAVHLGRLLELPAESLRDLAHGMLLRDASQPAEAFGAEELPEAARRELETHAEDAYERLHRMQWGNASIRLVVQQHHERQDGSGYPANLQGVNTVRRLLGQRFNRDLMHPLSEIAGVADVFTALNGARPYRSAFSPRQIASELLQHGERTFSKEAVRALLQAWAPPREVNQAYSESLDLGASVEAVGLSEHGSAA